MGESASVSKRTSLGLLPMATHAGLVLDVSLLHLLLFDLLLRHLSLAASNLGGTVRLQGGVQWLSSVSGCQWHVFRIVLLGFWLLCRRRLRLLSWSIVDAVRPSPRVTRWQVEFRDGHSGWLRIRRSRIKLLCRQSLCWQRVILCRGRLLVFLNLLVAILRTLHSRWTRMEISKINNNKGY